MKVKFNVKRELKIGAAIGVVVIFIAFTERKQELVSIRDVTVKVHGLDELSRVLGRVSMLPNVISSRRRA